MLPAEVDVQELDLAPLSLPCSRMRLTSEIQPPSADEEDDEDRIFSRRDLQGFLRDLGRFLSKAFPSACSYTGSTPSWWLHGTNPRNIILQPSG